MSPDWPLALAPTPHLVAHVDLGEAEGAEVGVGALHRRLDGLSEQLFHKLANERPHLLHRLDGRWSGVRWGVVDSRANQATGSTRHNIFENHSKG